MYDKKLHLVVDMNGCPNRCRHCWLGHMPNRIMEEDADSFIMNCFYPYFEKIAYYSWLREPDYCDAYKERWERDKAISKNCEPERFELASFYRIVRDPTYIPFLRSVGVKRIQLTFFGLEETQGRYVGRKGAYEEIMKATGLLIEGGIIPRWQCFINEENKDEIVQLYEMAQNLRKEKCPELEFFVHEGTCEGENRKLYPIRICKKNIPEELIPVYLNYEEILSEKECVEILMNDDSHPEFPIGDMSCALAAIMAQSSMVMPPRAIIRQLFMIITFLPMWTRSKQTPVRPGITQLPSPRLSPKSSRTRALYSSV